jgi:hypothetical protein
MAPVSAFPIVSQRVIDFPAAKPFRIERLPDNFSHSILIGMVATLENVKDFHISPWTSAVYGRTGVLAVYAHGIGFARFVLRDLLNADFVLPIIPEVLFVEEAVTGVECEVRQPHLPWVVREAYAPGATDSVLLAVNVELVEMKVFPPHGDLEDVVKVGDGHVAWHEETSPDHGAHVAQRHFQAVDFS